METELKLPEGPWTTEPDFLDGTTNGYKWEIHRNRSGVLCGYIYLPQGHPWYGKPYDDIPAEVHGGLTFSDGNFTEPTEDGWKIGFDCAHGYDLIPSMLAVREQQAAAGYKDPYPQYADLDVYRDFPYVLGEINGLIDQAEVANADSGTDKVSDYNYGTDL